MTYRLTLIAWDSHGDPRATEVSEVLLERVEWIQKKITAAKTMALLVLCWNEQMDLHVVSAQGGWGIQ